MTTADARGRRFDAATGIVGVAFFIVGFLLPGTPPTADDSILKINEFLTDSRDELLAGNFLLAIGSVFFVWWLGSLRSYLRAGEGGEGRLSSAAFGGGLIGIALTLAGAAVFSGLVFKVAKLNDATLNRALFDIGGDLFVIAGAGLTVLFGAAACSGARSGALPPWLYWLGAVAAPLQLLSVMAIFASSGFFAAGGEMGFIAFAVGLIWIVAVSVVMIQRDGVPPVVRTEP
jgi:hypothetical protein